MMARSERHRILAGNEKRPDSHDVVQIGLRVKRAATSVAALESIWG
jgi:hypothetical protein